MKKFLIATFSVVALSGALGAFPVSSEEPLMKELQGLNPAQIAQIKNLMKELTVVKQGQYKKDEHKLAQEDAQKVTFSLADVMKKMSAPVPPVAEDNPMMTALSAVLPEGLKDNPFFKLATKSVGGWANESAQLTHKVEQAPSAFSVLASLFESGPNSSGGGMNPQMANIICGAGEALLGIPHKACNIAFAAMGK